LVGLNDDFAAKFVTACGVVFSALLTFVSFVLGFHNVELEFHVCTGHTPDYNVDQWLAHMKRKHLMRKFILLVLIYEIS
jgi:hypothetical protein